MKLISCEVRIRHGLQDEAHFYGKRFRVYFQDSLNYHVKEKKKMLKVKQERQKTPRNHCSLLISI